MKILFLPLVVLLAGPSLHGQETPLPASITKSDKVAAKKEPVQACTLESAQMPLLKGVRIGSTYDEVKEIFPEIEANEWFQKNYRVDKSGLFMVPAKEISIPKFRADLAQLSLNLQDDRITVYNFIYKSKKWKSLGEMIDNLTEIYGVSRDHWTVFNEESIKMECVDFIVYASHITSGPKPNNTIAVHKK